jgi:hypothetical protein
MRLCLVFYLVTMYTTQFCKINDIPLYQYIKNKRNTSGLYSALVYISTLILGNR